ncbi:MAG TPA: Gfo/Idh/MocA family oxidoreductase [Tepidisphaeraceae bacterium]|nr:Gfo/Idh/MocA family oxidoreductase [Tepidisphaeraceae bacterium]
MKTWRIAGINFDHMHMGDLPRMAFDHPQAQIVGVCDEKPERMREAVENFGIPSDQVFTDYRVCIERTRPDLVILCPATGGHAEWTEKVAPLGANILMEKPFAASLADADRMIAAVAKTGKQLAINWPMRWYPSHCTAKRLIDEGAIGEVTEVHYYDGNRGPTHHRADKVEVTEEEAQRAKATSWWYKQSAGGGSLLDYLGYGTTLGTWFMNGKAPLEVTCVVDQPAGLEVDEHSVTVARYETGLSKFETRWGTFTDPWTHQPQPKCGFVLVGREGTISSYDREEKVRIQTRRKPEGEDLPAAPLLPPYRNPIEYVLHCMETGEPINGPLSVQTSRIGQQIVDAALRSARERRTVSLTP